MICFNDLRIQAVWQSYQRNMDRKKKASLMDRMHYPESATTWAFLRGPNQYWNSLWAASPHVAGSLKPRTSPRSIKHGLTQPCVYVICIYIYIINILCKYIYIYIIHMCGYKQIIDLKLVPQYSAWWTRVQLALEDQVFARRFGAPAKVISWGTPHLLRA